jgi:hypothetical protein
VALESGTSCTSVRPPPPPAADDPLDAGDQSFVVVMRSLDLRLPLDGGSPPLDGYDIDKVATCCQNQPGSCVPRTGASDICDEDGGKDNTLIQLLRALAAVGGVIVDQDYVSARMASGSYSLIVRVSHYNGAPNDTAVAVAVYATHGIDGADDAGTVAPRWDGTDRWNVDTSYVVAPDASAPVPAYFDPIAYVSGGTLVAQLDVPFRLGRVAVSLTGGILTADIVPAGDGTYRLDDGLIAGRWSATALLGALHTLKVSDTWICPGTPSYNQFKLAVCQTLDVCARPAQDNQRAPCDAISLGFGFTAQPALLGSLVTLPREADNCADGGVDDDASADDCSR